MNAAADIEAQIERVQSLYREAAAYVERRGANATLLDRAWMKLWSSRLTRLYLDHWRATHPAGSTQDRGADASSSPAPQGA